MLENDIVTTLGGASSPYPTAAGSKVYPVIAPQGTSGLYITFQRVANTPVNDLLGSSGLDAVRIQVDSWADSALGARTLARQVRTAMAGAAFKGLMLGDFEAYEPETRKYRVSQDFRCWERL